MLTAQYILTAHITGQEIDLQKKKGFILYFRRTQQKDGSWGLHDESDGYLFVTTLVYVALRCLGQGPGKSMLQKARAWIRREGGVVAIPTWGKLWLALMNLYKWEGVNPILPELWLLPSSLPFHPRRFYCHTRLIYLPIGVLYACRYQTPATPFIELLREELYLNPYKDIPFARYRHNLRPQDLFERPGLLVRLSYELSSFCDRIIPSFVRNKALMRCMERIRFELKSSGYACISPVNGLLNALALWIGNREDPDFRPAFGGVDHWLWANSREGHRYCGARSHTWDTSFAVQAIAAGGHTGWKTALRKAFHYFDRHQILEENPFPTLWFREPVYGGYCFSVSHHRWPVSDCTAEALTAMEQIHREIGERLPDERLEAAALFLLRRQNRDGGFGTYEPRRGNWFLEHFNPSEMYGNCMLEHSYIECTTSCIHGLGAYMNLAEDMPAGLRKRILSAIDRGVKFLRKSQRRDGSWPGFWGVNFTYGTLFAVAGIRAGGASSDDPAIRRARIWIRSAQLADGGWGETWQSCVRDRYEPRPRSQVVQTSWALMGLLLAGEDDRQILDPAVRILAARQEANGDWPKEGANGVFFNTAMLYYCLYKNYFPVWALGLYEARFGETAASA